MKDCLVLVNPRTRFSQNVTVLSEVPATQGAEEKSYITFVNGEGVEKSLFKRKIESEKLVPETVECDLPGKTLSERYCSALLYLQDAGLPVADEIQIVSTDEVAVTNYSSEGREVFDVKSETLSLVYPTMYGERSPKKYDDLLKNIPSDQLTIIGNQIAECATQKGVKLPDDGLFSIVFNNDQTWEVMLLDIALAKIYKNLEVANLHLSKYDWSLGPLNQRLVRDWVESVKYFQTKLSSSN